jgi:hypothetical protein
MQSLGTDYVRTNFGDSFWIDVMERSLCRQEIMLGDFVLIGDVRFQNEAEWVVDSGGIIIHLTRDGAEGKVGIPDHPSEAGVDFSVTNFKQGVNYYDVTNNSTRLDLKHKLKQIIESL